MCFFALASVLCKTPQKSGAEPYNASLELLFLRAFHFIEEVMCTLKSTDFLKSFPVASEIESSPASAVWSEIPRVSGQTWSELSMTFENGFYIMQSSRAL